MTLNITTIFYYTLLFLLLSAGQLSAQYTLTGTLTDAESNEPLIGGYVKCTHAVDTTIYYGMSDYDGRFSVEGLEEGDYITEFTYVGYDNLRKVIAVSEDSEMGAIGLQFSSTALDEIQVTARRERITQRGDTTQYNAAAYGTNPDAAAEDLLQKMPGFSVTDGKMQVQGENITRILVNGKPFFGDDPELALKNLPAEVIANIQVYDRSSEDEDEEGSGGSGDGAKTVNIVLKESYNNGIFGNLNAGYGLKNKYQAGGNVSFFNENRRINILGQFNNINQQNFSSTDLSGVTATRGKGKNKQRGVGGNNFLVPKRSGINTTNAVGINYQENWGKRAELSGSYFFNRSENVNETTVTTTYFDPELPSYKEEDFSNSNSLNHRLNAQLRYRINDRNTITFKPNLTLQQNSQNANGLTDVLLNDELNNTLSDMLITDLAAFNFTNRIGYNHKFAKKGRGLNIFFTQRLRSSTGDEIAMSNSIALNGMDSLILNQHSALADAKKSYYTNVRFTEPLGKKSSIALGYIYQNEQNEADILTYNFSRNAEYDELLSDLSNQFNNAYQAHQGELTYRFNKKKLNLILRANYQTATLDNQQLFPTISNTNQQYRNLLPFANFRYNISKQKSVRFTYRTRTNLPRPSDLQDVVDNSNPLRIRVGNPNLNQQVSNNFDFKYSANNVDKGTVFFLYLKSVSYTDYIGRGQFVAAVADTIQGIPLQRGARLQTPINLTGYRFNRLFTTYGLPLIKIKSNLNLNVGISEKRIPSQLNGTTIFTNTQRISTGFALSSNISKDVDFIIKTTSVIDFAQAVNRADTRIFNQRTTAKLNYILEEKWQLTTNVTHHYFNNFSAPVDDFILWNASVGYKFLTNRRAELRLTLFDILNSNTAIQQFYGDAYFTQRESLALTRFLMLSLRYNLRMSS